MDNTEQLMSGPRVVDTDGNIESAIQPSELLTLARFEVKMLRSIIADVHEVAHLASCTRVTGHIQRAMRMLDETILPKGPL